MISLEDPSRQVSGHSASWVVELGFILGSLTAESELRAPRPACCHRSAQLEELHGIEQHNMNKVLLAGLAWTSIQHSVLLLINSLGTWEGSEELRRGRAQETWKGAALVGWASLAEGRSVGAQMRGVGVRQGTPWSQHKPKAQALRWCTDDPSQFCFQPFRAWETLPYFFQKWSWRCPPLPLDITNT